MLRRRNIDATGMGEGDSKITFENCETIEAGGYTFKIETKERYWNGYNGKMENLPGFFMEGHVALTGCPEDAVLLEKFAAENKLVLDAHKKETTCEPPGYAELYHKAVVEDVREEYPTYLGEVPKRAKDFL